MVANYYSWRSFNNNFYLSRGAYGINGEDVFNTEHMPLKDSQDLNLFNTDGNNDVNEYLYNDDGGAQAFEGIHENLQQ